MAVTGIRRSLVGTKIRRRESRKGDRERRGRKIGERKTGRKKEGIWSRLIISPISSSLSCLFRRFID
jgi:hypothetical protein